MSPKKILYIVEADLKSGSGKCLWELVKLTREKTDFSPVIVTQYHNNLNDACDVEKIENYAVHYARTCSLGMGWLGWLIAFACRPFLNYFSYTKLSKKVNFNSICLIHSNSSSIDFGAYLYRKLHIPHIWHIREFIVYPFWKPLIYNLPKYIVENSSTAITVSYFLKHNLEAKVKYSNIQAIYDGVPRPTTNSTTEEKNNKIFKIACVGNIAPLKGQEFLLEALSQLPQDVSNNIMVDFFGEFVGNYKEKINQIVKQHSLEKKVSFLGFREDIQTKLLDYDIGIQPSHSEGFSRVTVEYMLAGLCVIGNGDTAIHELIDHERNGFLYKDYDIHQLVHYISFCYQNRKMIKEMGKLAQKKALDKYCIDNNFDSLHKVYIQALSNKSSTNQINRTSSSTGIK